MTVLTIEHLFDSHMLNRNIHIKKKPWQSHIESIITCIMTHLRKRKFSVQTYKGKNETGISSLELICFVQSELNSILFPAFRK